jgi:hypothetical protein
MCFTCKTSPAAGCSAYCARCQPRDTRPQPRASQCGCSACGRIFATLTDFDRHHERHPRGHQREGVFTGRCLDPVTLGLVQAAGVWGTPEGNARRRRSALAVLALRRAQTA